MPVVTPDRLDAIKDRLFDATYDDRQWPETFRELRAILSGSSIVFGYWDGNPANQTIIHSDCAPEFAGLFFEPELKNPFPTALKQSFQGDIFTDTTLMPRREFQKTPIYNEWLIPQGEHSYLQCKLVDDDGVVAHFGLLRGGHQPEFGADDIALLQRITPVLSRVARLRRRIGKLHLDDLSETYDRLDVGFAVAGPTGVILHHNAVLEALMVRPDSGLTSRHGAFHLTADVGQKRLTGLIWNACQPTTTDGETDLLIVSPLTGAASLAVSISPIRNGGLFGLRTTRAALVVVHDLRAPMPAKAAPKLIDMFGLTAAEASLALALASGLSLRDIADQRDVAISTARSQLGRIFFKTDTEQQSQLVALINRLR
tara:strand:+ start:63 stop:1175 length:1113 start_codon:yes stop_codon:yes gene_type:complete